MLTAMYKTHVVLDSLCSSLGILACLCVCGPDTERTLFDVPIVELHIRLIWWSIGVWCTRYRGHVYVTRRPDNDLGHLHIDIVF